MWESALSTTMVSGMGAKIEEKGNACQVSDMRSREQGAEGRVQTWHGMAWQQVKMDCGRREWKKRRGGRDPHQHQGTDKAQNADYTPLTQAGSVFIFSSEWSLLGLGHEGGGLLPWRSEIL